MKPNVAIINFGAGNLFSVHSAVTRIASRSTVVVTDDPKVIADSDRIILPGQANASSCLRLLQGNTGLRETLADCLRSKPVLGICVGQHLLGLSSEESNLRCLGFLACNTKCLQRSSKVPHIGWSAVWYDRPHPILHNIPTSVKFYFAHSYSVSLNLRYSIAFTFYGQNPMSAVTIQDNIITTQFHPEKSSCFGFAVLHNFMRWKP